MRATRKKRVTLSDVAARAGVSTAVASYAINNGPRPISDSARARVQQAIDELGYHPNAFAQAISSQRSRTIGVVIQSISLHEVFESRYPATLLSNVAAGLKQQRYFMLVYGLELDEPLADIRALVQSRRLDGVIIRLVQDSPHSDALLQTIADAHLPCICIERPGAPRFGFGSITYNDRQAAYGATRFLVDQGHRSIAHVQGDTRSAAARDRCDGYRQALEEAGLAVDQSLIVGNSWALGDGIAATDALLARAERPTAIFAANDYLAIGALTTLRKRGLQIPTDVAVIGYDDIPLAAEVDPPLTTVRVPLPEMGTRAATNLISALNGQPERAASQDVVPAELIRRASA